MLTILSFFIAVVILGSIFFIGYALGYKEGFDDGLLEASVLDDSYDNDWSV